MNKILLNVLAGILFFNSSIFSQEELILSNELPFKLNYFNEIEIRTTQSKIEIIKGTIVLFNENLNGRKEIIYSPNKNYFSVTNYEFSNEKTEYNVTNFIFNSNGNLVNKIVHTPFFDLPHPLYSLDNEGDLSSFDIYYLIVTIDKLNGEKLQFQLEKDLEDEIERSGYVYSNGNNVFAAVTLVPADLQSDFSNVMLYSIEKVSGIIKKNEIELSQLTGCYFDEENLVISGVKYKNGEIQKRTLLLNNELNIISENNSFCFELMVRYNNKLAATFFEEVFLLNNNLEIEKTYNTNTQSRLKNLISDDISIYFISSSNNKFLLEKLNDNFNIDFKKSLTIFDTVSYFKFKIKDNKIIFNINEKTFIYN